MRGPSNEPTIVTKPTTSEIERCDDCDDECLSTTTMVAAAENENESLIEHVWFPLLAKQLRLYLFGIFLILNFLY
jgi:hypothetical protein